MRKNFRIVILFVLLSVVSSASSQNDNTVLRTSREEVLSLIHQVNGFWQAGHPNGGNAFWDNAAYQTGNMEAYKITGNEAYKEYALRWSIKNQWKGATSDNRSNWKYTYGETNDFVLFGDWQICFQTYIDLYLLDGGKDPQKIARAREVMEYQMSTPQNDYWWWADGLYMVMPVMTKLYNITQNPLYLQKLHEYFDYANEIMFDAEAGLYFRDQKYVYPKHKTTNEKKDFWARGNGWVFAGLAKTLVDLPQDAPNRSLFENKFKTMAKSVAQSQQPEGFWSRSMLDLDHAPSYETSGTAFFTYGLFWGINNGYLQGPEYLTAAIKGWNYLKNTALQHNGKIGYVQPIGERANQHKNVGPETTTNFGVGAWLLAASELIRYLDANIPTQSGKFQSFTPGKEWPDDKEVHINAHGGGILFHKGKYYWFGENRPERGTTRYMMGVNCYSSTDLYNWKYESLALSAVKDTTSDITQGCIMERPKVIYNPKTKQFVMYFHLELKGRGYEAARVGIATSEQATGPYKFISSFRPNAGKWPENMTPEQRNPTQKPQFKKDWTPEWIKAVEEGLFTRRDFEGGQMSRDMTLFVDDDGKAYHIYASEENLTLHIAELSDDFLSHTGKYVRVDPAGHNEAPAIFKKDGTYYMITSGCTGWQPNEARLLTAQQMMGPWTRHPNPCVGKDAELTFHSQSTYILPVIGKKDCFIFMADRWLPRNLNKSPHIWLPISFENGLPILKWEDNWDLTFWNK